MVEMRRLMGGGLCQVILYVEYLTMCIALPGLSYAFEAKDWDAILHYDWADWSGPPPSFIPSCPPSRPPSHPRSLRLQILLFFARWAPPCLFALFASSSCSSWLSGPIPAHQSSLCQLLLVFFTVCASCFSSLTSPALAALFHLHANPFSNPPSSLNLFVSAPESPSVDRMKGSISDLLLRGRQINMSDVGYVLQWGSIEIPGLAVRGQSKVNGLRGSLQSLLPFNRCPRFPGFFCCDTWFPLACLWGLGPGSAGPGPGPGLGNCPCYWATTSTHHIRALSREGSRYCAHGRTGFVRGCRVSQFGKKEKKKKKRKNPKGKKKFVLSLESFRKT